MHTAAKKMADNFRSAIARALTELVTVKVSSTESVPCYAWLFQVFAFTAGLYGCQVWAT